MEVQDSIRHIWLQQISIIQLILIIYLQMVLQWQLEISPKMFLKLKITNKTGKIKWRFLSCISLREMLSNLRRQKQKQIISVCFSINSSKHSCFSNNRLFLLHQVQEQESNLMEELEIL
jgi:hypothetical protein